MATAPLLSIGMIFKNEERCLERCLKSLEPLRKAVPCELIMADTGAEDGSRAIAERYADEVFDFPWINDFAAARNAVMDRCSGKWYFSIDCDEWLDEDISELTAFLTGKAKVNYGFVFIRNYLSLERGSDGDCSDFFGLRLLRMATGQRFEGTIHEFWPYTDPVARLGKTLLYHDGYAYASAEDAKKKNQRNMALLREKLKAEPENLRVLMQCIESGTTDADLVQYVRTAVGLVQQKRDRWQTYGPCILRHAAEIARIREMPELEEWIEYAEKEFPDSIFTLVDLQTTAFKVAYDKKDWAKAITHGETYQEGIRRLRPGHLSKKTEEELGSDSLAQGNGTARQVMRLGLADSYLGNGQGKKALEILAELDGTKLPANQTHNALVIFCNLHARTQLDVSVALTNFYEQIGRNEPDEKQQKARLSTFDIVAAAAFTKAYQREEKEKDGWHRPAYTALRCLADKCEAGRAAAILMAPSPAEIREWLLRVKDWQALPIEALERALQAHIPFPLPEKPLSIEVLDGLAAKLPRGSDIVQQLVIDLPKDANQYPDLQSLFWAQALTITMLRSFKWGLFARGEQAGRLLSGKPAGDDLRTQTPEEYTKEGFTLLRRFARVEDHLLPLLYAPGMLCEENAALLPPMQRWGLYCSRALNALDSGRPQEYLALLRKGLKACPGEKEMVQFMLDRFVEIARPKASPELLALAEQVRKILSAYDPADPAVAALKTSPAYQKVAWIIEDSNAGGLPS